MFFDTHTHSTNSDGKDTVEDMCLSAIENGIDGLTITDHANIHKYHNDNTYGRILKSIADVSEAKDKYGNKLKILTGVELGEYAMAPQCAKELLSLDCFDAVLCSVHYIPKSGWLTEYGKIDFQNCLTTEEINNYISLYFDLLSQTIDLFDFDILAHIHGPVRYITGKYNIPSNIMLFEDKIRGVLEKIIKKNAALEINTIYLTDKDGKYNFSLDKILCIYKELGGKMVTLGSDAHHKRYIGNNFAKAISLLKSCGFDSYYYFENRKPKEVVN